MLTRLTIALFLALAPLSVAAEPAPTWEKFDEKNDPTPQVVVERMLKMAQVGPEDTVYDLGCGDGRIVITAAKLYGARGVGVDFNPTMIARSRINAEKNGVAGLVTFVEGDIFKTDLDWKQKSKIKVFLFLWYTVNARLRPRLLEELLPGTIVVSHQHLMWNHEDKNDLQWFPDSTAIVKTHTKYWGDTELYLWKVPMQISGAWRLTVDERDVSLKIRQSYQRFDGTATIGGYRSNVRLGRISGTEIAFYTTISGTQRLMRGSLQPDGSLAGAGWIAIRD